MKPRRARSRAIGTTPALSWLLTLMNAVPLCGSCWPAPICAFANADPNVSAPPMTSPVDFISGPSSVSTPGKRTNGNTGVFTKNPDTSRSSVSPCSASVRPIISLAATFASGTPVAFERYGTVRDARGFTSST